MANIVTISGMFGIQDTYFAGSPVVIEISGLAWPETSPFTIVKVDVLYNGVTAGEFRADTAGQTDITFDISPALRTIWADIDYADEVARAQEALTEPSRTSSTRSMRPYSLCIRTEYIASDGLLTETTCEDSEGHTIIPAGRCLPGRLTEWERLQIGDTGNADVSALQGSNTRFGDASTKPKSSPERVGIDSITSWVDIVAGSTTCAYWPASSEPTEDSPALHAPLVLRDSQPYVDFLFVNRRGAVETCSAVTLEALTVGVTTTQYARVGRPSFAAAPSLMAIAQGGRRSWGMSSGFQTREWAEWWAQEFLLAKQWWMRTGDRYVPVTVSPSSKDIAIYDSAKQQMPHVDFTVTMAVEG